MATNWVKEVPPHESGLESLTENEWAEIWERLRLHTWRRYGPLRDRLDLDDVVQQAMVDTLAGRRHWPKKEMSLLSFLCAVVRSIVSHWLEREKRKVDLDSLEGIIHGSIGEYLRYEAIYNQVVYELLVDSMYELVERDEVLMNIMNLWSREPDLKPSEIAAELGLSMDAMRNAQKRLRRKLQALRKK